MKQEKDFGNIYMITGDGELTCNLPFNEIINNGIGIDYLQNSNLISLPLQINEFPCVNSDESTLYHFENGGYVNIEMAEMVLGKGYWLRFEDDEICTFSGLPVNEIPIVLTEDWNLIGSISSPINVNTIIDDDNLIIPGTIYSFTPNGYLNVAILEPGNGYWIRSNNSGSIILISE